MKPDTVCIKSFPILFLLLTFSCSGYSMTVSDQTQEKVTTRRGGKILIKKTYRKGTNRLISKEKIKDGQRIYYIEYNEKGKVHRSVNRRGKETLHKRGCDC